MFTSFRPKQTGYFCVGQDHLLLRMSLKDVLWVDFETFAVLSDVDSVLVPVKRLSHVQSILSVLRNASRIVCIIPDHGPVGRIAHALVHLDGIRVTFSDKKIHEPCILLVASLFKRLAQKLAISESSILWCN